MLANRRHIAGLAPHGRRAVAGARRLLGALNRIAQRTDASALALRGIAMAQLGEFPRARTLLRQARRMFGRDEVVARARCVLAEADIALASRDLVWPGKALRSARSLLSRRGDSRNAHYARLLEVRHLLMTGRLSAGERQLRLMRNMTLPASLRALRDLLSAGAAVRGLRIAEARLCYERAALAARDSGIPALQSEIDVQARTLDAPAARLTRRGTHRLVDLQGVADLQDTAALIVDDARQTVRNRRATVGLRRRPVLWRIVLALAQAWPRDADRRVLIQRVFRVRRADETHRARLRVEVGRVRRLLQGMAQITATESGYALVPVGAAEVLLLSLPIDEPHVAVLALLADGVPWSSSALALALGTSQRSVQRILETLEKGRRVRSAGRGRARRWLAPPLPAIATSLLLPIPDTGP